MKEEKYIDFLSNISIFENFTEEELESLLEIVIHKKYPKNYTIVRHNDLGDSMFIIMKGKVKISLFSESGREVIIDVLEGKSFFGEMSLIDEMPRSANVITMSDVDTLMIKRDNFIELMMHHPNISLNILKIIVKRLRKADATITSLSIHDVTGRIAKFITSIFLEKKIPLIDNAPTEFKYTHKDIGARVGATRESVTRALNKMINQKIISLNNKQLVVYDSERLIDSFQKSD